MFNIKFTNIINSDNTLLKCSCIVALVIVLCSCNSNCLDTYINDTKNDHLYTKVERVVIDSLNQWINKNARLVQNYKIDKWRLDGLAFNTKKNRFIGWIVCVHNDKNVLLDRVDIIGGYINPADQVSVYFGGVFPTIYYERKSIDAPHTLDELSKLIRADLVKGGIINSCSISDDYINRWFINRSELIKHHKELLCDTIY